ncbi:long-chain fatty acid--CoA ligase [Zhongshania borealis]|uniref:Fatty-acid--CoA ligase n=1 Tax=Zhongshania borealis TaxID=889488 RepID=A0ABP7WRK8_9GAMM
MNKDNKVSSGMQEAPMNLASILEHAARFHGNQEIVSRLASGEVHRYTYREALARSKQLANALKAYGIEFGDRIATMAWNGYRHFESWYGIAGQGAICHTVNPRLFPAQIRFIINHAGDRIVFVDPAFVGLLEEIQDELPTVEMFVVLSSNAEFSATTLRAAIDYESFIGDQSDDFDWVELDEAAPSSLCYTSGTTGDPKGVLYSHRSNLLMAYASSSADAFKLSALSTVLMVVPMFHANSWGLVYSAPMSGAKLVLPGPNLDGASIYDLVNSEKVTFSAAVPTVWSMLLDYMTTNQLQVPALEEVVIGGSALPRSMLVRFKRDFGVDVLQAWGMTEVSPLGSINRPMPATLKLDGDAQLAVALKQGRPLFGLQMCIKDENGLELPFDGKTPGRLMVRGPWVVSSYYKNDSVILDSDGWFDTADIATIDAEGFMQITDRAKDIIKSGGEWISSVDLENAAMNHPEVALAAVIGVPHPKWEERPLLLVKLNPGAALLEPALKEFLIGEVAKWWIPEDIKFVADIPLTATGKINKMALRDDHVADYKVHN